MAFYAHSLPNEPDRSKWETMAEHEELVAKYCGEFVSAIDPSLKEWGELLGQWHDLGKYSEEFQSYICAANDIVRDGHVAESKGRVDHSTAAAQLAMQTTALLFLQQPKPPTKQSRPRCKQHSKKFVIALKTTCSLSKDAPKCPNLAENAA